MLKMWKYLAMGVCALALNACALPGMELAPTKAVSPGGTEFSTALYKDYLDLSQSEYDEADYWDSDYFALKAQAAARGETVAPTEISERELPAAYVGTLTDHRARLVGLLDASARVKLPVLAARAQTRFDCWMQEQEENFQPDDIAACREGLDRALKELEAAMAPPQQAAAPAPAPAPAPEPQPAQQVQKSFLVFFNWDSSLVTPQAVNVLDEAVKNAKASAVTSIRLIGHADTSGASAYNDDLSLRRADAVRAALQSLGLGTLDYEVTAKGETDPLVPTEDGIREPQNRRVQILLP